MRITGVATTLVVLACTSLSWVGCSSDTCIDRGNCEDLDGGPGSDGPSSDAPGIDAPPGCDLTKSVKDSPACIDDGVGVFVSASGDDGATGKKAAPVKTIGKGLELAAASALPRVYVCEGNYDTATEIKAPVAVYGGLSCAWAYTGNKPKLAPAKGVALKVTSVSGAVLVQDLEIDGAADSSTPGDSAIAVFVSHSLAVTLTDVALVAGAGTSGGAGADGTARSNYTGESAAPGAMVMGLNGGAGGKATCVNGNTSTGGNGGNNLGVGLTDGSANPAVGGSNSGATMATACTPGNDGANGPSGASVVQSNFVGVLTADGWSNTSPPANNAPSGLPAQGGGGGGTKLNVGSPGGGGGAGGCGGSGGGSGLPGGSSFALLSFQSTVSLEGVSVLKTGAAGAGGKGGAGQVGQKGGAAGAGAACDGGPGGIGSGGSGGSGGAGGYSVPVAYAGTAPSTVGAMLTPGALGPGGDAGDAAAGTGSGNAGAAGVKGKDGQSMPMLSPGQ